MTFEDSFAGLLVSRRTGAQRESRIPRRRCRILFAEHLLQEDQIPARAWTAIRRGRAVVRHLRREDEATSYFCIDDDPKYRRHCTSARGRRTTGGRAPQKPDFFIDHFVVTNRVRITVKRSIQSLLGNRRRAIDNDHNRIGWAIPGLDLGKITGRSESRAVSRDRCRTCSELSDLLASRSIPLTIVVYPWAQQTRAERSRQPAGQRCGAISVPAAARRSSTCFRSSSPPPTPTRTGTSTSTFSATIISRPPATGSCFGSLQDICCDPGWSARQSCALRRRPVHRPSRALDRKDDGSAGWKSNGKVRGLT